MSEIDTTRSESDRYKTFLDNYNNIKRVKKVVESLEFLASLEPEFKKLDPSAISTERLKISQLLYNSFIDIQKGDYKKACDRIEATSFSKNIKDYIYFALNSYCQASHATFPYNLTEERYVLRNIETDRKELGQLTDSFLVKEFLDIRNPDIHIEIDSREELKNVPESFV